MGETERTAKKFWDGHSFSDDCSWQNEDWSLMNTVKLFFDRQKKIHQEKVAFSALSLFLSTVSTEMIKAFAEGETFQLSRFPLGTILKYSYDWQEKGDTAPTSIENEWGILMQEVHSDQDVIIGFETDNFEWGFDTNLASRMHYPIIRIGQILHTRKRSSFSIHEDLTRFNSMEIWQYGVKAKRAPRHQPRIELRPVLGNI